MSLQNREAIGIIQNDEPDSPEKVEISLGIDLVAELGPISEDELETSELESVLVDITHIVTCLYKFSNTVRNPVPRERIQKIANINVSHFEVWDIKHMSEMFPTAPIYLIERLGKANTRRRQLLQYLEEHHDKIARYIDADELNENTSTVSQTTVSTIRREIEDFINVEPKEDQLSQTSYGTSTNQKIRTLVPPPPNKYDGQPFECPYCFQIIQIGNQRTWR